MKTLIITLALSCVAMFTACGGPEDDDSAEGASAALQNTGRGPAGSCTINLCSGLKQPGEMACHFGVCICVAGDKQVQCTNGNDQCDECIPLKPFPGASRR